MGRRCRHCSMARLHLTKDFVGVHLPFIVHLLCMDEQGHEGFWRTLGSFFWELLKAFILAMVIIVPIRYFLVQPFFVRGASMEPNYQDSEYLIVDQLSYRFREPQRGDVIVFRYPQDESQFFIKRIVGLPNETIRIDDGHVFVNGRTQLDERGYLSSDVRTGGQMESTLQEGEYFVLGDNREASSDSRSWGPVQKKEIMGRTWIRAWPFTRFTFFSHILPPLLAVP